MTVTQIVAIAIPAVFVGGFAWLIAAAIRDDNRATRERAARHPLPPILTTQGQIPPPPHQTPSGFIVCERTLSRSEYERLKRSCLAAHNGDATP